MADHIHNDSSICSIVDHEGKLQENNSSTESEKRRLASSAKLWSNRHCSNQIPSHNHSGTTCNYDIYRAYGPVTQLIYRL